MSLTFLPASTCRIAYTICSSLCPFRGILWPPSASVQRITPSAIFQLSRCLIFGFWVMNSRHLKRTLSLYFRYYHESRTHLSLGKQCPFPREALSIGKIVAIPQLGGLHHRYERVAG